MGQPGPPVQTGLSNGVCICLPGARIGLEGTESLDRYHYPVLTCSGQALVTCSKIPLPQKVELGLELSPWTRVPSSFLLPLLVLTRCQAKMGGIFLQPWTFREELFTLILGVYLGSQFHG